MALPRAVVGGKIPASGINAIIDKVETPTRSIFTRAAANVANSSSVVVIPFNANPINGGHVSHAAGVFTFLKAGTYLVTFVANCAANSTGSRSARIAVPTMSPAARTVQQVTLGGLDTTLTVIWLITVAVNDTLTTSVQQNSGGALAVGAEIIFEQVA